MKTPSFLRRVVLAQDTPDKGYPFELPVMRQAGHIEFGDVTILVGENGSGKSTLVEAIAVIAGLNAEGGSKNLRFETKATHSALHEYLLPRWKIRPSWGWFLRAETFYGMATAIDDDPYLKDGFPALHSVSHGESFLALATSRFLTPGFYVLDEPESALSIQGQMRLMTVMAESVAGGSQFVIATHSALLTGYPGARIFELDGEITERNYDEVASVSLWRRFFADPQAFLDRFL